MDSGKHSLCLLHIVDGIIGTLCRTSWEPSDGSVAESVEAQFGEGIIQASLFQGALELPGLAMAEGTEPQRKGQMN